MMNSPVAFSATDARAAALHGVTVRAPGRLHLGFLDPGASLGRRFGSLGLVVGRFETVVQLWPAARDTWSATPQAEQELERAAEHVDALRRHTGLRGPLRLHVARALPAHAGFGSGTQLALAVGRAFAQLHGLGVATPLLARWLGRGARSGVGIAGFDHGGLLLDGGPGDDGAPAPLIARHALPPGWRVLLVLDPRRRGLSGSEERRLIAQLPPFPRAAAAEICHRTMMQILPGAAGGDFARFAEGVTHMQRLLGRHFAPAQGGGAYTSAAVGRLLDWIAGTATSAVGQSSWGPTGFAIVPSSRAAHALVEAARAAGVVDPELELHVVPARNAGAAIGTAARSDFRIRH